MGADDLVVRSIVEAFRRPIADLARLDEATLIEALNAVRTMLHEVSPHRSEPIDLVLWVPADQVRSNDYNPNTVAPPEMKLLEHSIAEDGYTQPVVTWLDGDAREVVDGFHRTRVGLGSKKVHLRTKGFLPVTTLGADRAGRGDRISSTIRHNRARGKHGVEAMSKIVVDLAKRNWSDEKIGKELGMQPDEVLRLKQITGLAEMFASRPFSEAWEIDEQALGQ